jgi:hypothetical protein
LLAFHRRQDNRAIASVPACRLGVAQVLWVEAMIKEVDGFNLVPPFWNAQDPLQCEKAFSRGKDVEAT